MPSVPSISFQDSFVKLVNPFFKFVHAIIRVIFLRITIANSVSVWPVVNAVSFFEVNYQGVVIMVCNL
jgi:hypothetical protein